MPLFGYVRPNNAQLRVCEYETYRAAYCTLCKHMGKEYGQIARMTLNYDFTFLAVLMLSLADSDPQYSKKHCVYNPFKRCTYMLDCDDVFSFVSAVSVISVYGKVIDNINDTKGAKKLVYKIAKLLLSRKYTKAEKKYPDVAKTIEGMVKYQFETEKNANAGIDEASEPTAKAMETIFSMCSDSDNSRRILSRLGYCVGKWIYLIDAVCDINDDIKSGSFNPLKAGGADNAVMTMNVCSAQAGAALELLDIKRFGGILQNIIYIGLPETAKSKMNDRKEKEHEKSI